MPTQIFVNLPVKDLAKSIAFFQSLGFSSNPQFTDETAACMVVSGDIYVMLLTDAKFKEFTPKQVCDATKCTEVLVALSCEGRAAVDEFVRKAVDAGGSTYSDPKDYGFMYTHGFQDPDGHIWEVLQRLAKKNLVVQHRDDRAHRYAPTHGRDELVAGLMVDALDQAADSGGREAALVHFVERVGADEAAALRRALAELETKHGMPPSSGGPGSP